MERIILDTKEQIKDLLYSRGILFSLETKYSQKQRTFEEIEKGPPEESQEYLDAIDGAFDAVITISEIGLTNNKNKPIKKMIETYRSDFSNQDHPYWYGVETVLKEFDAKEIYNEAKKSFDTIDDIRNNLDVICSDKPFDLL